MNLGSVGASKVPSSVLRTGSLELSSELGHVHRLMRQGYSLATRWSGLMAAMHLVDRCSPIRKPDLATGLSTVEVAKSVRRL